MSLLDPARLRLTFAEANCEHNGRTLRSGVECFYMDGDPRKVRAAARRHVDQTGHVVVIDGYSMQYVRPGNQP
jgi:hypothetical protein